MSSDEIATGLEQPEAVPAPLAKPGFEPGELDWVEKAGLENLKERLACADILAKEAATTMTVLLAGTGGSLAYAIKLLDGDKSYAAAAAAGVCIWLTVLSVVLVWRCLRIQPISSLYNEPGNLLARAESNLSYNDWRAAEVRNIQKRIEGVAERNNTFATSLNWLRALAALTPLIAVISIPAFSKLLQAISQRSI